MSSTLWFRLNVCGILIRCFVRVCCFLPSYGWLSIITSRTDFLSGRNSICSCFKVKTYGLFDLIKYFEEFSKRRKSVDILALSHLS